ncbi:MAG TPA: hypothetical protein VJ103_02585 [Candidatus Paceibacterota bacterium]|nr:hypothetical protein [Candidatus Paceibacterota bacterium]
MKEKEYSKKEVRDFMYGQLALLMKAATGHIFAKDEESKKFYNSETHHYIEKNGWELLFPMDKDQWPTNFQEMGRRYDSQMSWPGFSTYCYLMDVIAPPFIPHISLHFGYAVVEGKLTRSTFFVVQGMVKYQLAPQGMVIDPLADVHGAKPSFYVGCPVLDKKYIEDWMISRKNPLEMYVKGRNEEEYRGKIRASYMAAYWLQMEHEPQWFPKALIKFAEEEGLHIPDGQKSSR